MAGSWTWNINGKDMTDTNTTGKLSSKVMNNQWDILILLDACRYDYFAEEFQGYLSGKLDSIRSLGTATPEWRDYNFTEPHKDTVYVSSNPYIRNGLKIGSLDCTDIFHKVEDIWEQRWNNELGTVMPSTITDSAVQACKDYSNKRIIVHYLQPHAPYISLSGVSGFIKPGDNHSSPFTDLNETIKKSSFRGKLFKKLIKPARKIKSWGNKPEWKLGQLLCLPPQTPMDAVRRKYGTQKLQEAYRQNLKDVLAEVALLYNSIDNTNKKVIITSDHGEQLGENNNFAHPIGSDKEVLRKVPWFEIQGIIPEKLPQRAISTIDKTDSNEKNIEQKLKDLGYM